MGQRVYGHPTESDVKMYVRNKPNSAACYAPESGIVVVARQKAAAILRHWRTIGPLAKYAYYCDCCRHEDENKVTPAAMMPCGIALCERHKAECEASEYTTCAECRVNQ